MDYNKIGKFISAERKAKKLTQAKLADKLFVSEKTISKWENGNGIPDTNVLPKLCEIFQVSINELLNGERLSSTDYTNIAESTLLSLQIEKEKRDKMLLSIEIVMGALSVTMLCVFVLVAGLISMQLWVRIALIVFGFLGAFICAVFGLKIEQIAGFYVCKKCNHKYIPSYKQVFYAMHMGRTRYMKCPKCNQKSWNKKVVK